VLSAGVTRADGIRRFETLVSYRRRRLYCALMGVQPLAHRPATAAAPEFAEAAQWGRAIVPPSVFSSQQIRMKKISGPAPAMLTEPRPEAGFHRPLPSSADLSSARHRFSR
jgi:hypothetical protein